MTIKEPLIVSPFLSGTILLTITLIFIAGKVAEFVGRPGDPTIFYTFTSMGLTFHFTFYIYYFYKKYLKIEESKK